MTEKLKIHETIGCCGIDCGLCPRFYTKGDSACPGCGGVNFKEKHPSCGILSCCAIKNGYEVCADCHEFPCRRFDSEKDGLDSFVTHKKIFENQYYIKNNGIDLFIKNQSERIQILKDLISGYDDGRSKGLFCTACALLPLDKLREVYAFAKSLQPSVGSKENSRQIRDCFTQIADSMGIELKLKKR